VFEPATYLPCQVDDRHPVLLGERRLMIAVLADAIRVVNLRHSPHRRATVAWFESPSRAWPFAFERVCDALALDAATVRNRTLSGAVKPPQIRTSGSRRRVDGTLARGDRLRAATSGACSRCGRLINVGDPVCWNPQAGKGKRWHRGC
jgi:hypothetical protein